MNKLGELKQDCRGGNVYERNWRHRSIKMAWPIEYGRRMEKSKIHPYMFIETP